MRTAMALPLRRRDTRPSSARISRQAMARRAACGRGEDAAARRSTPPWCGTPASARCSPGRCRFSSSEKSLPNFPHRHQRGRCPAPGPSFPASSAPPAELGPAALESGMCQGIGRSYVKVPPFVFSVGRPGTLLCHGTSLLASSCPFASPCRGLCSQCTRPMCGTPAKDCRFLSIASEESGREGLLPFSAYTDLS